MNSLAVGATVVLYDGNPLYPDWRAMRRMIGEGKVAILGRSAIHIYALMSASAKPGKEIQPIIT